MEKFTAATDANPPKEVFTEPVPTLLTNTDSSPQIEAKKPGPVRKPRADKGVPRKPAEKPEPKKRLYHLAMGAIVTFESLAALEKRLAELDRDAGVQQACGVIEGGKRRSIQKRFSLR